MWVTLLGICVLPAVNTHYQTEFSSTTLNAINYHQMTLPSTAYANGLRRKRKPKKKDWFPWQRYFLPFLQTALRKKLMNELQLFRDNFDLQVWKDSYTVKISIDIGIIILYYWLKRRKRKIWNIKPMFPATNSRIETFKKMSVG